MITEQDCWHALFSGNLRRAAEGFESLRQHDGSVNAEAGLFLVCVFAGASQQALAILTDRDKKHGDLGLLLWRAAWIGASNNLPKSLDLLESFLQQMNAPASWMAPLFYGRGHIAAIADDRAGAVTLFVEAGQAFGADPMLYLKNEDSSLRSVVFQSMHMLTEDDIRALAEAEPLDETALGWLGRMEEDDGSVKSPRFIAAADPHYLHLYGADFVTGLLRHHPDSRVHLHIADGTADDFNSLIKLLDRSARNRVSGSISSTGGWQVHKPPVYASMRFLVAPVLLERFQEPLLLLDIDSCAKRPLDELLHTTKANDLSCWIRPDGGPGGYTAAGAVGLSGRMGKKAAGLAAAYIGKRFSEESQHLWFVDQAALFRAAHYLEAAEPLSFQWGDFSPAGSFEDYFDHAPESPDKRR